MKDVPYLRSLRIENYRGFEKCNMEFGQPVAEHQGSGLTILVGPNNSGKTTVIEALSVQDVTDRFSEEEIPADSGRRPTIARLFTDVEEEFTVTNYSPGSSILKLSGLYPLGYNTSIVPTTRSWAYTIGFNEEIDEFVHNGYPVNFYSDRTRYIRHESVNRTEQARHHNDFLKRLIGRNGDKKLLQLMKRFIPDLESWGISTRNTFSGDYQDYIWYQTNTGTHDIQSTGHGVLSLFTICAYITAVNEAEGSSSLLVIDEPELSLHPQAQKTLASLLSETATDRQVLICTHSPYFVNWQDLQAGAIFVRLNKPSGSSCTTAQLRSSDLLDIENIYKNDYQQPHVLDTVAKEIMFTDKVLFVEGQEDVGILRKYFSDIGFKPSFDIFGYGVGGHNNMCKFLSLAKKLGLLKVAALYDGDKDALSSFKRDKKIYKNWCLESLPIDDIRDKDKVRKKGCFTSKGILKPAHEEVFQRIMHNICKNFGDAKEYNQAIQDTSQNT